MNNGIVAPDYAPPSMPRGLLGKPSPVPAPRGSKQRFSFDPNNLTLVCDTSLEPADLQVSVPIAGTSPSVVIDWGDGSSEVQTTTGFKTHTYSSPGVYVVQISGRMTQLDFGPTAGTANNKAKVLRCLSFGDIGISNFCSMRNCINLIECPPSLPASITSIGFVFSGCTSFNDPNVCRWDTSRITNTGNAFSGATAFNQPIGNWDTSRVASMISMFSSCPSFNQPLGNWDTSRLSAMANMFNGATSFNQQIGGWSVSSVTSCNGMFSGCTSFRQTLHGWDMSGVSSMFQMFVNSGYNQDVSAWDIRKAVSLALTFTPQWGNDNYSAALIAWAALPDEDLLTRSITAFSQNGTNTSVTTSGSNFLATGSRVRISGTTNYDGDYNVFSVSTSASFTIPVPFVANDATGTLAVRRSRDVILNLSASVKYTADAAAARDTLINTYGWVITDGGQA